MREVIASYGESGGRMLCWHHLQIVCSIIYELGGGMYMYTLSSHVALPRIHIYVLRTHIYVYR